VDSGHLECVAVVLLWIQVIWNVLQYYCCGFRSSGMGCSSIAVDSGHLEYVAVVLLWIQVIWNVLQ